MKSIALIALCASLTASVVFGQQAAPSALPIPGDAAGKVIDAVKESERLQEIADKALEAAGEKAAGVKDKVKAITEPTDKKKPTSASMPAPTAANKAPDLASEPAKWGKDEVHQMAVMDVEYGGSRESVVFYLLDDVAPAHVANFIENCNNKVYRDLAVHRAIDGYLVQTGDPLTADQSKRNEWGTGGEEKSVPAEFKAKHKIGAVAMARRSDRVNPSKASNGYQFYFCLGNMSSLDGSYSVFGQVVSGLEVLESISRAPTDSNDCPLARIEVKSIKIVDHKGPMVVMRNSTSGGRKYTKPASAKSGWERILERIW